MANKESTEKSTATTESTNALPVADLLPVEAQMIARQDEQIAELKALIGNLGDRFAAAQSASTRDLRFKTAVESVEAAAAAVQRGLAQASPYSEAVAAAAGPVDDRSCGPCECVASNCCTFEIWMSHVRADQMQTPIDIGDSNTIPTSVMEIWMFASIDPIHNVGACIPSPSPICFLPLHKQITEPFGPWTSVNRLIGTKTVKKGVPTRTELSLTGVERETALERVKPVNRDEWGVATESLTLDCCYSDYSPILITVPLASWGQAGGVITGRFIVVKRCC